jgi:PAS domain-containing protein
MEKFVGLHDPDGKIIAALGIMQDIAERKRAEEMLRASEERFLLASRATGDVLWNWNVVTGEIRLG